MEYKFGELLKEKRKSMGLSQGQLAQALSKRLGEKNYSKVAISKWERHYYTPRPSVIDILETVLSMPAGLLLDAAGYYEQAETKKQGMMFERLKEYIEEQFRHIAANLGSQYKDPDTGKWIYPSAEDKVRAYTEPLKDYHNPWEKRNNEGSKIQPEDSD